MLAGYRVYAAGANGPCSYPLQNWTPACIRHASMTAILRITIPLAVLLVILLVWRRSAGTKPKTAISVRSLIAQVADHLSTERDKQDYDN